MTDEMTDNQVLSILNQIEAEAKAQEAVTRGFRQVREVILKYMAAQKFLGSVESEHKRLTDSIAGLKPQYETELRRAKGEMDRDKASYVGEIEALQKRTQVAREAMQLIEKDLADKQKFFEGRSAQMDEEIRAKSASLEGIKADLESLRKKHGVSR